MGCGASNDAGRVAVPSASPSAGDTVTSTSGDRLYSAKEVADVLRQSDEKHTQAIALALQQQQEFIVAQLKDHFSTLLDDKLTTVLSRTRSEGDEGDFDDEEDEDGVASTHKRSFHYSDLPPPACIPTPDQISHRMESLETDVFLSHKRTDTQDFARALKETLTLKFHYRVFLDQDSTADIGDLLQSVRTCKTLIFILSSNIFSSEWCRRELREAILWNVPIVLLVYPGARWHEHDFPPEYLIPPELHAAFATKAITYSREYHATALEYISTRLGPPHFNKHSQAHAASNNDNGAAPPPPGSFPHVRKALVKQLSMPSREDDEDSGEDGDEVPVGEELEDRPHKEGRNKPPIDKDDNAGDVAKVSRKKLKSLNEDRFMNITINNDYPTVAITNDTGANPPPEMNGPPLPPMDTTTSAAGAASSTGSVTVASVNVASSLGADGFALPANNFAGMDQPAMMVVNPSLPTTPTLAPANPHDLNEAFPTPSDKPEEEPLVPQNPISGASAATLTGAAAGLAPEKFLQRKMALRARTNESFRATLAALGGPVALRELNLLLPSNKMRFLCFSISYLSFCLNCVGNQLQKEAANLNLLPLIKPLLIHKDTAVRKACATLLTTLFSTSKNTSVFTEKVHSIDLLPHVMLGCSDEDLDAREQFLRALRNMVQHIPGTSLLALDLVTLQTNPHPLSALFRAIDFTPNSAGGGASQQPAGANTAVTPAGAQTQYSTVKEKIDCPRIAAGVLCNLSLHWDSCPAILNYNEEAADVNNPAAAAGIHSKAALNGWLQPAHFTALCNFCTRRLPQFGFLTLNAPQIGSYIQSLDLWLRMAKAAVVRDVNAFTELNSKTTRDRLTKIYTTTSIGQIKSRARALSDFDPAVVAAEAAAEASKAAHHR